MLWNKTKRKFLAIPERTVLVTALILPVIHFCLAKFAISLSFQNGTSAFWPSSGVYLAGVLLLGFRIWPAILLSELIANTALFYKSILTSVPISVIDLIDPLLTGFLINRFIQRRNLLEQSQDVFKFIAILPVSSALTTTLAIIVLCLSGDVSWSTYGEFWRTWAMAIMAGELLLTPALLAWTLQSKRKFSRWQSIEFVCLLFSGFAISRIAFGLEYPVEYILIPLSIWSVFRFGERESTLLVVMVSAIAAWGTAHGSGSFVRQSISESLLLLQSFMAVVAITTYILCAVINENNRATVKIAQANEQLEERVESRTAELRQTLEELQQAQAHLIQSEKMSSLGQLVAGVAHEINNPVNFIHGNLTPASEYTQDLMRLVQLYQQHYPNPPQAIEEEIEAIDLEFLSEDLTKLLQSMRVGTERIREIVKSLRNFSRLDEAEFKVADIHEGIDSTLMILQNRLKPKSEHPGIEVIKEYATLPLVKCYPGQLNQVFMNLLNNAIDALDERNERRTDEDIKANPGKIWIRTEVVQENWVAIRIADNGGGMSEEVRSKLFDPFFTTKPVGKGTGLGLSISYQIVTEKHGGKLTCNSTPGRGAELAMEIPVQQTPQQQKTA